MAKFCTECGKEIAQGVTFCTECGTKAPADPAPSETATEAAPAQTNFQAQQTYTQPASDPAIKVVGTGTYFGLMLLFGLPFIGFIACIIMTFAAKNKNIKNFAKAILIWTIIAIVLIGILSLVITLLANSLMDYLGQLTDGQLGGFGEAFGQFDEIQDSMNELENITNQFQDGNISNMPLE